VNEIKSSTVHRNLDAKLKIVGLEIYDLLFVLLVAAVMNLIFGRTSFALYLVFLLPSAMALVLFFAKRNKPEQYLVHLLRFVGSPGFYSANEKSRKHKYDLSHIDEG